MVSNILILSKCASPGFKVHPCLSRTLLLSVLDSSHRQVLLETHLRNHSLQWGSVCHMPPLEASSKPDFGVHSTPAFASSLVTPAFGVSLIVFKAKEEKMAVDGAYLAYLAVLLASFYENVMELRVASSCKLLKAGTLSSGRFMYVLPGVYKIKKLFNFGSEKKLQKSIAIVHKFADDIIKSIMYAKEEKTEEDLLSRFMGNSEYSPEFHRNILTKLETIRSRPVKSYGEFYNFDELRQMNYLHVAISEGLRLYPPVLVDTKACLQYDVLHDGTFVGKNWFVTYHTYAMGRIENIWGKDCSEFMPERWLEEDNGEQNVVCRQKNSFKYPVFHGGPRICLGKEMMYTQTKLVAATIIKMFEVEVIAASTNKVVEEKSPPEHVLSLTMRMKDGLMVRLIRKR
ncbi:cytochrome P450 94A2-like protein [Tanacetum coccineum]